MSRYYLRNLRVSNECRNVIHIIYIYMIGLIHSGELNILFILFIPRGIVGIQGQIDCLNSG